MSTVPSLHNPISRSEGMLLSYLPDSSSSDFNPWTFCRPRRPQHDGAMLLAEIFFALNT